MGKITVLGSGTAAVAVSGRHMSGYLLEADGKKYLFDCGPGTLYQLVKIIDIMEIDHIFISHMHVDHFAGLFGLLWAYGYGDKRIKELNIYGSKEFKEKFEQLVAIIPLINKFAYNINIVEAKPEFEVDSLKITTKKLNHYDNIGYRVEKEDKVFVYSGDTPYCPALVDLSKGADLLIIECGMMNEPKHGNPTSCGRVGREANVKTIVLTHYYPEIEVVDMVGLAAKEFDGKIIKAEDMMELEL